MLYIFNIPKVFVWQRKISPFFFVILQSRDRISSILVCQITNIFMYMQCNWLNKIQYYHFLLVLVKLHYILWPVCLFSDEILVYPFHIIFLHDYFMKSDTFFPTLVFSLSFSLSLYGTNVINFIASSSIISSCFVVVFFKSRIRMKKKWDRKDLS